MKPLSITDEVRQIWFLP